jgi:hypothetical protein
MSTSSPWRSMRILFRTMDRYLLIMVIHGESW